MNEDTTPAYIDRDYRWSMAADGLAPLALPVDLEDALDAARDSHPEVEAEIERRINEQIAEHGVMAGTGEWLGDWSAAEIVRAVLAQDGVTAFRADAIDLQRDILGKFARGEEQHGNWERVAGLVRALRLPGVAAVVVSDLGADTTAVSLDFHQIELRLPFQGPGKGSRAVVAPLRVELDATDEAPTHFVVMSAGTAEDWSGFGPGDVVVHLGLFDLPALLPAIVAAHTGLGGLPDVYGRTATLAAQVTA